MAHLGFHEMADSKADQSEGAMDKVLATEQPAAHTIDFTCVGRGFFDGDLAAERCEIAVAHFYLDGVSGESSSLEFVYDFSGLLLERSA